MSSIFRCKKHKFSKSNYALSGEACLAASQNATMSQAICSIDEKRMWINPGSTAYRSYLEPCNEYRQAEYMCISGGQIAFKGWHYDYEAALKDVNNCAG